MRSDKAETDDLSAAENLGVIKSAQSPCSDAGTKPNTENGRT